MKFIKVHETNVGIVYKNSVCSMATLVVVAFALLSFIIPLVLISLVKPFASTTFGENRVLYEQPTVQFKYQSMFFADLQLPAASSPSTIESNSGLILCSTFAQANTNPFMSDDACNALKYWTEDVDHNGKVDRLHFQQEIDYISNNITQLEWILWLDATLQENCLLNPPAVLTARIPLPTYQQMPSIDTIVVIEGDLKLIQNEVFVCPKTTYQAAGIDSPTMFNGYQQYRRSALLQQLREHSGYFALSLHEKHHRYEAGDGPAGLRVHMQVNVRPVDVRYCVSKWERLGLFLLYFITLFIIAHHVLHGIKDYLFAKSVIRAWAIIPWKKLY